MPIAHCGYEHAQCSICKKLWMLPRVELWQKASPIAFERIGENTILVDLNETTGWARFSDLPEDLQAVALAEML